MTLTRETFGVFRSHFPSAACRVRNTIALIPWYAARVRRRIGGAGDAYDGAFWDFHETGDWTGFARIVLQLFPSRSIVDIGCGQGTALEGFARTDSSLVLRGFDDSPAAVERARARKLAVDRLDVVALSAADVRQFSQRLGQVDLVICLEVIEHLPSWHGGKLLDILTCGRRLIFSAAHPNQGGTLHINERSASYWIDRLGRRGFRIGACDRELRAAVAGLDLPWWYKENIHAFERQAL